MKKKSRKKYTDDIRPEYDFSKLKKVTGKNYFQRYQRSKNLVLLAPEVVRAFPNTESINEALRLFIQMSKIRLKSKAKISA